MIGFMLYSEAFFLDFEALFVEVSRLSKCKSSRQNMPKTSEAYQRTMSELEMLECIKEAVVLHQRVIRYEPAPFILSFLYKNFLL